MREIGRNMHGLWGKDWRREEGVKQVFCCKRVKR